MKLIANPFVAVLDANVLYPVRCRDVLFSFAEAGLFRARLTEDILREWTVAVGRRHPTLKDNIERQAEIVRAAFGECFVTGYDGLGRTLDLPDPDDRHVLAAAIRCSAQVIVTQNLKDFPEDILEEHAVEALSADDFLHQTYDLFPVEANSVLRSVRSKYRDPSMTASEFLTDLTRCGLPKLAAIARRGIDTL